MRRTYLPLFRKHRVRMTVTGHDHFYDHWVEHYDGDNRTFRMDHIVSGGGGAPVYVYRGEQDLDAYAETALPLKVRVEHLTKPGTTPEENPHHFVVAEVDGDRLWIRVVGVGTLAYRPYAEARIELDAPASVR